MEIQYIEYNSVVIEDVDFDTEEPVILIIRLN
jgi:hypothetical protein